jgi:hypothetical protein
MKKTIIKKTKTKERFTQCEGCRIITDGFLGSYKEGYLEDAKKKKWKVDLVRLKKKTRKDGIIFHCSKCGFISEYNLKKIKFVIKETDAYVCPCGNIVSRTMWNIQRNKKDDHLYITCKKCGTFLEKLWRGK